MDKSTGKALGWAALIGAGIAGIAVLLRPKTAMAAEDNADKKPTADELANAAAQRFVVLVGGSSAKPETLAPMPNEMIDDYRARIQPATVQASMKTYSGAELASQYEMAKSMKTITTDSPGSPAGKSWSVLQWVLLVTPTGRIADATMLGQAQAISGSSFDPNTTIHVAPNGNTMTVLKGQSFYFDAANALSNNTAVVAPSTVPGTIGPNVGAFVAVDVGQATINGKMPGTNNDVFAVMLVVLGKVGI